MNMTPEHEAYFEAIEWCDNEAKGISKEILIHRIVLRLQLASGRWEQIALKEKLADLWVLVVDNLAAQKALEELVSLNPSSAMPLISLASHFLYVQEKADSAFDVILAAEKIAPEQGHYLRHTLANKSRIALALKKYEVLEDCICQIAVYEPPEGIRDVRKERDFFDQADKTRFRPDTHVMFEKYWSTPSR